MSLHTTSIPAPSLSARYHDVRALSMAIAAPLSAEDQNVQSMPDASPIKWHLAHTTWFFEKMILSREAGYEPFDARFDTIFNSYYLGLGVPFTRANRGLLTRPSAEEVRAYRMHVDAAMDNILPHAGPERRALIVLGLNHEQQHQELMLTDILHAFAQNPIPPAYDPAWSWPAPTRAGAASVDLEEGIHSIGHHGNGFHFDNEEPAHRALVGPVTVTAAGSACWMAAGLQPWQIPAQYSACGLVLRRMPATVG